MNGKIRGRLNVTGKTWPGELGKLLKAIGATEWERAPQTMVTSAQIGKAQGVYSGVPCTAVWIHNQMALKQEHASSASLILQLSRPTDLGFQLRNATGVQRTLYHPQNADVRTDVDPRLLTAEEVSDLHSMNVPFVLNLLEDRVTITINGMYPAECYESFLELLHLIHQRVADLGL